MSVIKPARHPPLEAARPPLLRHRLQRARQALLCVRRKAPKVFPASSAANRQRDGIWPQSGFKRLSFSLRPRQDESLHQAPAPSRFPPRRAPAHLLQIECDPAASIYAEGIFSTFSPHTFSAGGRKHAEQNYACKNFNHTNQPFTNIMRG